MKICTFISEELHLFHLGFFSFVVGTLLSIIRLPQENGNDGEARKKAVRGAGCGWKIESKIPLLKCFESLLLLLLHATTNLRTSTPSINIGCFWQAPQKQGANDVFALLKGREREQGILLGVGT